MRTRLRRSRRRAAVVARGTLIHCVLENAMRGPTRDRTHFERLANWFTVDKPEPVCTSSAPELPRQGFGHASAMSAGSTATGRGCQSGAIARMAARKSDDVMSSRCAT